MLKKMLLFIAISSSFLPVLGETNRQKTERLEKQEMKQRLSKIENDIKVIQNTQLQNAICIAITALITSIAVIIAKSQ